MRSIATRILLLAAGLSLSAGCVHHRAPGAADRFFLHKEAKRAAAKEDAPPSPSLEEAIGKVRHLMAAARPPAREPLPTVEGTDRALSAALASLGRATTTETLYDVGASYHRLGLLDQAYSYYARALALNRRDAATYEALARVWRDMGLPGLGVGDAQRAIYYAPRSASAQNTLGTLLQALGLRADARHAYTLAAAMDRDAGYAVNNLCYLSFVEGKSDQALAECQNALRIDPGLSAAHNNLGLIYAAVGRLDLARREFADAGGTTSAAYNMGIVLLASGQYAEAADEFNAAKRAQPAMAAAGRRALDAERRMNLEKRVGGGE
jgi:tetratricopeptide (TPR) repeat protein